MLFKTERIAASTAVLPTNSQFTSDKTAVVPIVATALWQNVRNALIPAAFQNSTVMYLLPSEIKYKLYQNPDDGGSYYADPPKDCSQFGVYNGVLCIMFRNSLFQIPHPLFKLFNYSVIVQWTHPRCYPTPDKIHA